MKSHNPSGKVFSKEELQVIGDLCVKHGVIILSDEVQVQHFQPSATSLTPSAQVYDRLYFVPFTRIGTLSPEIANLTLTVGSVGKNFYATGWRIGYLIGPEHLIKYVTAAHMRICFTSVSPLQEAAAVGFEKAEEMKFWEESRRDMQGKIKRFTEIFDELGLPVSSPR